MFLLRKSLLCLFFIDVDYVLSMMVVHNGDPRYFAGETLSSSALCRMYLVLKSFAFLLSELHDI